MTKKIHVISAVLDFRRRVRCRGSIDIFPGPIGYERKESGPRGVEPRGFCRRLGFARKNRKPG